jgi:hypothetical protein
MANLKALETLAVERGLVSPGQVFEVKSKEDAAVLVAQGRAEETDEDVTAETEHQVPAFIGIKRSGRKKAAEDESLEETKAE